MSLCSRASAPRAAAPQRAPQRSRRAAPCRAAAEPASAPVPAPAPVRVAAAALAAAVLLAGAAPGPALAIPQTSACATASCDDGDYSNRDLRKEFYTKGSLKRANFKCAPGVCLCAGGAGEPFVGGALTRRAAAAQREQPVWRDALRRGPERRHVRESRRARGAAARRASLAAPAQP
jgi:hypothetical protein